MPNERAREDMLEIMDDFEQQMELISRLGAERARIIGRASVRGKRVTVAVNAEGALIDTRFSADIDDLDYAEIASAVTEAARLAAADAAAQARELMTPLLVQRARLPKLSDLIEGMPDLSGRVPTAPQREEPAAGGEESYRQSGGVTDSSW
ncbi:YbaB/EbfC family DNA-binding protein [Nocardia panacis]|uniref:YbaB/EbfC family DNA-binding protein n=1 Tax=Nocardia panacis TaxID=2340916 RepID=A0A3A4KDY6_9NOCA|nr:YbaB/EbfC family nucleoid-associated protein [Nocardia panacis]RJO72081.1 YbaB/EbfC family DNA-binding protein [Nocardia panacis]